MSECAEALTPSLRSSSTSARTLHACLVRGEDTIEAPFCRVWRTYRYLSTEPDDYSSHLFIYRILCCIIKLLWEKFQPLYDGDPFTADKNSKHKHAPIRELAAHQPLPQRDLCYLHSSLGLRPGDSLLGPLQRTLRWARSGCSGGLKANLSP